MVLPLARPPPAIRTMNFFTPQNAILFIGVLLLASPFVAKTVSLWLSSVMWSRNREQSSEIGTVVRLLELKHVLERDGLTAPSRVCQDLIYSVIYNVPAPPRPDAAKPETYRV